MLVLEMLIIRLLRYEFPLKLVETYRDYRGFLAFSLLNVRKLVKLGVLLGAMILISSSLHIISLRTFHIS